jgi:hypothetical protein
MGDDHASAFEDLGVLERRGRRSFSFANGDVLVDALEDAVHVRAGLDELGGEPQRLRRSCSRTGNGPCR